MPQAYDEIEDEAQEVGERVKRIIEEERSVVVRARFCDRDWSLRSLSREESTFPYHDSGVAPAPVRACLECLAGVALARVPAPMLPKHFSGQR